MDIFLLDTWWPLVGILCCGLLYVYGTWNYDYWKKRGVPYVKPQPFFGNIRDIIMCRRSMGDVYSEMYWELDPHPFGGIFKFRQPAVLVRDLELVKQVLVKDFPSFQKNDIDIDVNVDGIFGRNPFALHGEKWKTTRTRVSPAFTSGKLKAIFPLVEEKCNELKDAVEGLKSVDGVDVKEMAARYATDVVASCAYGVKCNALKNSKSEFREMGKAIVQPDFWTNLRITTVIFFPWISKLLKIGFISKKVAHFFERIIRETIAFREKNKVTRNDFMQILIDIKNMDAASSNPTKAAFTETDITAQAVTFFTDGFETSSLTISFTLYELAFHPDIQEKLRAEVEEVMSKHGGRLTYDGIQEMVYLDMVLSETQRLHPALYSMMKRCTQPFDLKTLSGRTCRIEVGTPVQIPVYCLHHDPRYFPEPKRFDPERFSEENKSKIPKYAYLPFGEGPRMCVGMRFAHMQVKAGIATLVKNFEIRLTRRHTTKPVELDPNYLFHYIKGGIWLDFVKREGQVVS